MIKPGGKLGHGQLQVGTLDVYLTSPDKMKEDFYLAMDAHGNNYALQGDEQDYHIYLLHDARWGKPKRPQIIAMIMNFGVLTFSQRLPDVLIRFDIIAGRQPVYPEAVMFSENAQFTDDELREFCRSNNIGADYTKWEARELSLLYAAGFKRTSWD